MKRLRNIVLVNLIAIESYSQNKSDSIIKFDYFDISLNIPYYKTQYTIDTLDLREGTIFTIGYSDFEYIIISWATNMVDFNCCSSDDYTTTKEQKEGDIIETRGTLKKNTQLFWKKITNGKVILLYDKVPEKDLDRMNFIFNDIKLQLFGNAPNKLAE